MTAPTFAEAGYAISPDILAAEEVGLFLDSLSRVARTRAGARGLMQLPSVAALANGTGLRALAAEALGGQAVPFKATLFDKSRGANWAVPWHQDAALPLEARCEAPGWGPFSTKAGVLHANAPAWALDRVVALRVHLDDSGPDNGPLRVIPGSHRHGRLDESTLGQIVRAAVPTECHVPRGGVLLMRPLILHSSPKIGTAAHRRVLHIEYADHLALAPGIRLHVA